MTLSAPPRTRPDAPSPEVRAFLRAVAEVCRRVAQGDLTAGLAPFGLPALALLVAWIASHIEAELPKSLGAGYTEGTLPLCEDYLSRFS